MEGIYSSNNQRIQQFKGIISNMSPSPVNAKMDGQFVINRGGLHESRSPMFDPYTSDNLDTIDSTLIRYLRSASPSSLIVHSAGDDFSTPVMDAGRTRTMLENKYSNTKSKSIIFASRGSSSLSPLSAVENLDKLSPSMLMTPLGFSTSVKDDEDVLVMDGISVGTVPGGRMRLAMESRGSSSSSSSPGNNFFKTEICRSWEDSGSCRFGSKCQFAHGKEELRPTRFPIKNKSEVQLCKSYATTGVCTYGTKCRFFHPVTPTIESAIVTAHTASSVKLEESSRCSISITSRNWLPQDDGIQVALPSSTLKPPASEDVDEYIQAVLHGPSPRRRLQVFAKICPDNSHPISPPL